MLNYREKQIIRQIDVLLQQQQNNAMDIGKINWEGLNISDEDERVITSNIMKLGKLDLSNITLDSNMYVIEDYISPNNDHECMYKCLDTLNIQSSTEDLKVQIEFPQCKYLNTSSDRSEELKHNLINSKKNDQIKQEEKKIKRPESFDSLRTSFTEKSFTDCSPTNNEDLKHQPTQVQDWLNQIISETEIEPVQNTEKQLVIG